MHCFCNFINWATIILDSISFRTRLFPLSVMKSISAFLLVCTLVSSSSAHISQDAIPKECNCRCSKLFKDEKSMCKNIYELKEQVDHVSSEIEKRTRYIGDLSELMERVGLHEMEFKRLKKTVGGLRPPEETVQTRPATETVFETTTADMLENVVEGTQQTKEIQELRERLDSQEALYINLLKVVEDLRKTKNEYLPNPQPFVSNIEDNMLGDTSVGSRDGSELAKNMSHLLAKVEKVENMTTKVQEELKSERRVRRHLDVLEIRLYSLVEDLNETRTVVQLLNDKFENASIPEEGRNDLVEEITISFLENLNRTLFDEQFQRLHYRLDGVAYKNETRDLYENLNQVRNDFANVSSENILQFEEELASLSGILTNFRENMTTELKLSGIRMKAVEAKTDEFESLKEQMNLLRNAGELIHSGIEEIWNEVQNIQNTTAPDIRDQLREIYNFTQLELKHVSENFKNLTSEMLALNRGMATVKTPFTSLKHEVAHISEDLTNVENRIDILETFTKIKLKEIDLKIQNATAIWDSSVTTEQVIRDKRMENIVLDSSCATPHSPDDHLLIFPKVDSRGQMTLGFGCRPVGRYVLSSSSGNMTCTGSMWTGWMPECHKLLEENEIGDIETQLSDPNPCMYSFGYAPDPVDCSAYVECALGSARRAKCPPGRLFDSVSRTCQPAHSVQCRTRIGDTLADLVPPILIEPDTVDKPYSLMATGPRGELIVHPRTTFTLHCVYPGTARDPPAWRFWKMTRQAATEEPRMEEGYENLDSVRLGLSRYSVKIGGASSRDSGVYGCVTHQGKMNQITVIVKSVQCPPLPSDPESVPVFYRPHPEGESRILSTLAEFKCRGGRAVTAMCTSDGTWSRPAPTRQECGPEDSFWGCPPIDTTGHPHLLLVREDRDRTVTFRCASASRLIGNAFSRCFNGEWTHTRLPRCDPMMA